MGCKIVSITGTKGKSTVAYLVDMILLRLGTGKETLRVDTVGYYLNGRQKGTFEESHNIYGFSPTVCPGRYLLELKPKRSNSTGGRLDKTAGQSRDVDGWLDNTVAILETSLGSSGICGTGFEVSDVGVWTNVFDDHLGSSDRLKTREDIAEAKDFVFRQIRAGGYAVFNAYDELVCNKTGLIGKDVRLMPCAVEGEKTYFDLEKHFQKGGVALVLRSTKIFRKNAEGERLVYDAEELPWTFKGEFQPSLVNLMTALATIYAIHDGHFPRGLGDVVDGIRLDPYGGRLTLLKARNGTTIIADYAHETESLIQVGELARKIAEKQGGKTVGVVRLSYDRTDKLIRETGKAIGGAYDELVVYDKIDGHYRKVERHPVRTRFKQKVGRVAKLFGTAIRKTNPNVKIIIREDKALEHAARGAGENDVVVAITNDARRSVEWIRKKFDAKFVK